MARLAGKLTDPAVRQAKPKEKPYKLSDGGGLFLLVNPGGEKYWRIKYRFAGKEKLLAAGVYPTVTLKAARGASDKAKEMLASGLDPGETKRQEKLSRTLSAGNSFEVVASEWYTQQSRHWSETHKTRTLGMLKNNLGKWLGSRPISEITSPELLAVLRKTESRGTLETARRSLQVAGQVFRYAVVTGRAERDPSQDLRGALATPKGKHFSAITDPAQLGLLLLAMDNYSGSPEVKGALLLSPLLFQRPGEIRQMLWADVDFEKAEWRYLVTKTQTPHIVPLSKQSIAILQQLKQIAGRSQYVFPSVRGGSRPLSDNSVRTALRSLGYTNEQQTPHGFRATARTMLDEVLNYRVELIEHQLAHEVKDSNGRAYNRTAHLPARKDMMQGWADYLDNLRAVARGENVVSAAFTRQNSL